MYNPITFHFDSFTKQKILGVYERPETCKYPMIGLPWEIAKHQDFVLTTQQTHFFSNHLQIIDLQVNNKTSIRLSVNAPSVFVIIMVEGHLAFYWNEKLISYAMNNVLFMTYCPSTEFHLQINAGKHVMLVVSISPSWFNTTERSYPNLRQLVKNLQNNAATPLVLPMCRISKKITALWESMRLAQSENFRYKADLISKLVDIVDFYNNQLEKGKYIKGQLSIDIANNICDFVNTHFDTDSKLSINIMSKHIKISPWKIREYAYLLFGKSIHKHVRILRMKEALKLLETSSLSVNNIANRVGYMNVQHFYTLFRKYYANSPSSFRKKKEN